MSDTRVPSAAPILRVEAVLENVPLAMDFVAHCAQVAGFSEQALYEIRVAVDEACANITRHAYAGMEPGDMEVSCYLADRVRINDQTFVIRIRDWGISFHPDDIADPDVSAPLEERTPGGLGLFLIRQFMDQVQFTFDPELGNELIMTKRLHVAN